MVTSVLDSLELGEPLRLMIIIAIVVRFRRVLLIFTLSDQVLLLLLVSGAPLLL